MRPSGVGDSAQAIARDLVDEIGWAGAIRYVLGRLWQEAKLLAAVVFV